MPRNVHPTPFIIRPSDEFAKNIDLRNLSRSLATKYADGHVVTDDDLQIMGRNLWNLLGVQDDFDAAVKTARNAILSVIIESDKPEIQAYPWETLYHSTHKFIGRNPAFTLTRRIAAGKSSQANLDKGPLRVLLFTSLPDDVHPEYGRLNVEVEQEQVQEALLEWIRAGVVQLEMPDDGRFSTLKDLLESFKPHVLFLSGHGKFHHEPHADAAYGEFLFESETGDGEAIRDEEIARALSKTGVQAVILSACESGKAASDSLSNGLMQQISLQGIPHVIGMRESVLDVAGIQFARTLCDELAGRERLDVALQSSRAAIQKAMDERGQWCLPMALSPNPQSPLIDWEFEAQAIQPQRINQRLNNVSLPARFVGRRAERRKVQGRLTQGALRRLLITGAGGQGKTALAGKLALDMQAHGWKVFAWNADAEKSWSGFELEELFNALETFRQDRLKETAGKQPAEMERAKSVLKELSEQFDGRVALFLDNLETLQDVDTFEIKDETIAAWLGAAASMDGVTVLATSRWEIPNWTGEILAGLAGVKYGDFLQIAIPKKLYIRRDQMRRVHEALGGSIRGLEFFDAALKELSVLEAHELLEKLEGIEAPLVEAKQKLQANMTIAEIYSRLPEDAKKLLARLPAYHEPVPMEGLLKLGEGLPEAENLLERLLVVSLLEASDNPQWGVTEYQCAPMVTDWMNGNGLIDNSPEWLNVMADYHMGLLEYERHVLGQAITTHHALRRAERHDESDRLTLGYIVGRLTMLGFYMELLEKWLPPVCNSSDLKTRADGLNQVGKLHIHIGNYETALKYLEQSLAISRKININVIENATINNIAQIHLAQGNYKTAMTFLDQSLAISRQIGDKSSEGITLANISKIFKVQGNYEMALSYLEQSLIISQQISNKANEISTLNNISTLFMELGDYKTALARLKQSLIICRQIGDKTGEGNAISNISQIYYAQGDYEMALSYLKQSLVIVRKTGDKKGEGVILNNISQIYHAQGDYEIARTYLEQSLTIRQQMGDEAGKSKTINNISSIYSEQGDYETALVYLEQSLTISQQIGDKVQEGVILGNIGELYREQGNYEIALTFLKQSLMISQQIGDQVGESTALNNISLIYDAQGDYDMMLDCLKQSLAISEKIGDKAGLCATLFNMGHIYAQNDQAQEAINAWVQVYLIAIQINEHKALQALSKIAPNLGLPEGLDGWEDLAQRIQRGEKIEFGQREEVSELERIRQFVASFVKAVQENAPEAGKYFEYVSKMAVDANTPPEYQELGKVLRNYMAGIKNSDLSRLPDDIRKIVEDELENK